MNDYQMAVASMVVRFGSCLWTEAVRRGIQRQKNIHLVSTTFLISSGEVPTVAVPAVLDVGALGLFVAQDMTPAPGLRPQIGLALR